MKQTLRNMQFIKANPGLIMGGDPGKLSLDQLSAGATNIAAADNSDVFAPVVYKTAGLPEFSAQVPSAVVSSGLPANPAGIRIANVLTRAEEQKRGPQIRKPLELREGTTPRPSKVYVDKDPIKDALRLRQNTEGNRLKPYPDPITKNKDGITIGHGLNISVQTEDSLRELVGNDPVLFNKFRPYVDKTWADLSPEDIEKLTLTDQEVKALNSHMAQYSLDKVANKYQGRAGYDALQVLADLHHYAGDAGIRSANSKLAIVKDGVKYNPLSDVLDSEYITDDMLQSALEDINKNTKSRAVKGRTGKLLNRF